MMFNTVSVKAWLCYSIYRLVLEMNAGLLLFTARQVLTAIRDSSGTA